MDTEHFLYPAILDWKGLKFDAYTRVGWAHVLIDNRFTREQVLQDIDEYLSEELYAHRLAVYIQEHLFEMPMMYSLPIRVQFMSVVP